MLAGRSHILCSQVSPTAVVLGLGAQQVPSCSCSISKFGLGEEAATVLVHHLIGTLSTTILLSLTD